MTQKINASYTRVEEAQRDAFLKYLNDNPTATIKQASIIFGIKYPRATAIFRQNRDPQP